MALNPLLPLPTGQVTPAHNADGRGASRELGNPDLLVYRETTVSFRLRAQPAANSSTQELCCSLELFGVGECFLTLQRLVFVWTPQPSVTLRAFEVPLSALGELRVLADWFWSSHNHLECQVLPFVESAFYPHAARLDIEAQMCAGLDEFYKALSRTLALSRGVPNCQVPRSPGDLLPAPWCDVEPTARGISLASLAGSFREEWDALSTRFSFGDENPTTVTMHPRPIAYADMRYRPPRIYLPMTVPKRLFF